MDPVTESVAAAKYLYQRGYQSPGEGITTRLCLDTRGYYQFGPAAEHAGECEDEENMEFLLPTIRRTNLAANGITPEKTVGQWRQSVLAK